MLLKKVVFRTLLFIKLFSNNQPKNVWYESAYKQKTKKERSFIVKLTFLA